MNPKRMPELISAVETINQILAATRKLFVSHGWHKSYNNNGWEIGLQIAQNTQHLYAILQATGNDGVDKVLVCGYSPDELIEKVALIEANKNKDAKRIHRDACCTLATITPCVCRISFTCPVHGSVCYGTHD